MTGRMAFYARDVYPDEGMLETSTTVIPGGTEQRTLETDEKAAEVSEQVTGGATKKGTLGVFAGVIALVALIAFLHD